MQGFHCRGCGQLLFKHDPAPIEEGKAIELKCRNCNTMNLITASLFPETWPETLDKPNPDALK